MPLLLTGLEDNVQHAWRMRLQTFDLTMQAGEKADGEQEAAAETVKEGKAKEGKDPADAAVENGSAKPEKQEEGQSAEKEKEKKKKRYKVDDELLLAFRYFDRNCALHLSSASNPK